MGLFNWTYEIKTYQELLKRFPPVVIWQTAEEYTMQTQNDCKIGRAIRDRFNDKLHEMGFEDWADDVRHLDDWGQAHIHSSAHRNKKLEIAKVVWASLSLTDGERRVVHEHYGSAFTATGLKKPEKPKALFFAGARSHRVHCILHPHMTSTVIAPNIEIKGFSAHARAHIIANSKELLGVDLNEKLRKLDKILEEAGYEEDGFHRMQIAELMEEPLCPTE